MDKVNWEKLKESSVTILVEIDGEVCLVVMDKEKHFMVTNLAKMSIHTLGKTGKSQAELNKFLGYKKGASV